MPDVMLTRDADQVKASTATSMTIAQARSAFPILSQRIDGKPLTYLDSAASAQKPSVVLDGMALMGASAYANVHRGLHHLSNVATERYESARERVRDFLGAERNAEIVFTKNATEAINLVASSYLAPIIKAGDEIVVSELEHHSNLVPWVFLQERYGAVLKWARVTSDGRLPLSHIESEITDRTRLIAITQMSNVLGTCVDVRSVCDLARARGIVSVIDGSQGAVHLDVNVRDMGCDFYVCTAHKLYGPSGIGMLYGRYEHLSSMRPFLGGGEMIDTVSQDGVTYARPPHRFEAGTPPILEAHGLHLALDFIGSIGKGAIRVHETDLWRYALERLRELDHFQIIGDVGGKALPDDRSSIISFVHDRAHAHDIAMIVDQDGVALRAGTHCAMPLLARFGLTASCRMSLGLYNVREDVDRMIDSLKKVNRLLG